MLQSAGYASKSFHTKVITANQQPVLKDIELFIINKHYLLFDSHIAPSACLNSLFNTSALFVL